MKPMHKRNPGLAMIKEHDEDCPGCPMCHGGKMADGGEVKPVTMSLPPKTASDLSKGMNGGYNFKEGGEVTAEPHESKESDDHEIHEMLGKEMMSAFESKDHKRIMDGIEACVLSAMNKHKE